MKITLAELFQKLSDSAEREDLETFNQFADIYFNYIDKNEEWFDKIDDDFLDAHVQIIDYGNGGEFLIPKNEVLSTFATLILRDDIKKITITV